MTRTLALALVALSVAAVAPRARADDGPAPPRPALADVARPGGESPFEAALDRFVPVFPATTARYFGFTDLGPRPGDAISAPSELERFAVLVAPPSGLDVALGRSAPGTPTVTAAPHPLLRLSGGGALSRAWSAPGSAFAATGWQATLAAPSGALRGRLAVTLAEEVRGTSASPSSSRVGSQSTASLQLRLAPPVLLQLEGHRISERGGPGDGVAALGARAGAVVTLWPRVLELTASGGADRVQASADPIATGRTSATAGLTAHLGPALTLSGSTAVQTGALTGAATASALFGQLPAASISTGAVAWRASGALQLSAAVSRVDTPLGPGAARQLRASWAPAPGGRLRVSAAYEESIDPGSGTRAAQALVQPSLRLGRYASVEASIREALRRVAGPVAHPLAAVLSISIRS